MKLLYGLILIGLLIHLRVALAQPLFGDETNTILMARDSTYLQLFTHQLEKIHPNGSYLMTKIWWDLGLGITGIRMVHWMLFSLTLWPVYGIFKHLGLSKNASLVGLVVWTLSPYILLQSYLIRMYAYGILFLVYSLYFTLHKRVWASTAMDVLGVSFVSGFWIYVLAKYLALGRKINYRALLVMGAAMGINVFTASNVERGIASHLDWMPKTKIVDVFSMLTTLLGLTSTGYFEGYSPTPSSLPLTLGLSLLIAAIIFLFLRTVFKANDTVKYFLKLSLFIFCGYLAIWLLALIFKLPLFHIRQLFPIATMLTISLIYISIKNFQANKLLAILLILPILILVAKRTIGYSTHPIYPEQMIIYLD